MSVKQDTVMVDLFVELVPQTPLCEDDVRQLELDSRLCRRLHKVDIHACIIDKVGERLVCHLTAADVESVRLAFRCVEIEIRNIWSGTIRSETSSMASNVIIDHDLRYASASPQHVGTATRLGEWTRRYSFNPACAITAFAGALAIHVFEASDAQTIRLAKMQKESQTSKISLGRLLNLCADSKFPG